MGETEVRAAHEAARPKSKIRYVVVYVANPHEPENARIDVLPNPMGPEADGFLELLGEGVRFGFSADRFSGREAISDGGWRFRDERLSTRTLYLFARCN